MRPYDLPAISALVAFEAAARNLSFKEAARELNVTPAAISHQVKRLESELGGALFRRQHRGVELTEAGAYLFEALRRGFEGMSEAMRDLRLRGEAQDVTVQATTAISAFWLTPQITAFWRSRPDIIVSQRVSDVVPMAGQGDLTIHYGTLPGGDPTCRPLFEDEIAAVASPAFAAARGIAGPADLAGVPLIHLVADGTEWTGWADWLAAMGAPGPAGRGIVVNNYMIALQLARDGAGAVLGWTGLIGPLLEAGDLVELVPQRLPSPHSFYLQTHPRASRRALIFRDWLVAAQG